MADLIATSGQVIEVPCDYDLVRIKTGGNCLVVRGNGVGRIGRIELTNTSGSGDCLIIGGKDSKGRLDIGLPKPGKIGGGFLHQPTKSGTSHNDCIQARGGFNVHLWDIAIVGSPPSASVNASQGVLFQNSGQGFPGPEDIVLHRCVFAGRFSNPVNWGPGKACGIDGCFVCGEKAGSSGSLIGLSGHTNPVNTNNHVNLPQTHPEVAYALAHLEVSWLTNTPPPPPPPDPDPDPPPVDPCAAVKAELEALKVTHSGVLAELALAEGKLDQIKGIVNA